MRIPRLPSCAGLTLATALTAQAPEITNRNLDQFRPGPAAMSDASAQPMPPPGTTGPALTLPRDRGAHLDAARERWSLKAVLRTASGELLPFQLTFLSRALGPDRPESAWSRGRLLSAEASLGAEGGKARLADRRRGRLGIPAGLSEDRLGLRCDGWTLTDPGDGHLHLDVPLTGGRVRLTLSGKGEPLSLPALEAGEPQRRTLRPRLEVEGRVELEGRAPLAVSGRALLLQEWGPDLPADLAGWDRAFVLLKDGRTLLSFTLRGAPEQGGPRTSLLELDPKGQPLSFQRPPLAKPRRFWTSPFSQARYPVVVQIQDPRQPLLFEPMMDAQEDHGEWVGAAVQWDGFGGVRNAQGALVGDAFLELAGYAHPVHGRY
ncbi:MAG TPA: lipocalin family protein [Holophagaceae bacterium]|nr:lipocalin family protein [Holophagaceae bacterium]